MSGRQRALSRRSGARRQVEATATRIGGWDELREIIINHILPTSAVESDFGGSLRKTPHKTALCDLQARVSLPGDLPTNGKTERIFLISYRNWAISHRGWAISTAPFG